LLDVGISLHAIRAEPLDEIFALDFFCFYLLVYTQNIIDLYKPAVAVAVFLCIFVFFSGVRNSFSLTFGHRWIC